MSRLRFGGVLLAVAGAVVGHDAAVDLAGEEPFEAADDVSLGEAFLGAAAGVVDGGLSEAHAHDDGPAGALRWRGGARLGRAGAGWRRRTMRGSGRRRRAWRRLLRSGSARGCRRTRRASRLRCPRRSRSRLAGWANGRGRARRGCGRDRRSQRQGSPSVSPGTAGRAWRTRPGWRWFRAAGRRSGR